MGERFVGDGRLRPTGRNDARCTGCHGIRGTRATRCHRHVRASTRATSLGLRGPGLHQRPRMGGRWVRSL